MTASDLMTAERDKARRHRVNCQWLETNLPAQIVAMREARGWTQQELAERIGTSQSVVSRLESPINGGMSLSLLDRVAKAFDVGLEARFGTWSELDAIVGQGVIVPPSFEQDTF